ncbi:MAG TPA: AraC family transcriptional regulator [Solirubrobacteraceae bacterium]|nr:AraC family transcriptional regulator [Solirubrobacteraceae bacterium]
MEDTRGILHPGQVGRVFELERPPVTARLRGLVASHWSVTWSLPAGEARRSEVLPHPALHLVAERDGVWVYGVPRAIDARVLEGSGFATGARFRPGAFGALVSRPVSGLTGRRVTAAEVFGAPGAALERAAAGAGGTAERVAALEAFLLERLPEPTAETGLVRAIVDDIAAAPPGTAVADLAARHGISTRTLQRLFARHVGVSPKWVLRRLRMHDALEALGSGRGDTDWTRFALELGYFDHAHFIRDFRAVVGRSPAEYAREAAAA